MHTSVVRNGLELGSIHYLGEGGVYHEKHNESPVQRILGIDVCWGCVAQLFHDTNPHIVRCAALQELTLVFHHWPHEDLSGMAAYLVTSSCFFDSAVSQWQQAS